MKTSHVIYTVIQMTGILYEIPYSVEMDQLSLSL